MSNFCFYSSEYSIDVFESDSTMILRIFDLHFRKIYWVIVRWVIASCSPIGTYTFFNYKLYTIYNCSLTQNVIIIVNTNQQ